MAKMLVGKRTLKVAFSLQLEGWVAGFLHRNLFLHLVASRQLSWKDTAVSIKIYSLLLYFYP